MQNIERRMRNAPSALSRMQIAEQQSLPDISLLPYLPTTYRRLSTSSAVNRSLNVQPESWLFPKNEQLVSFTPVGCSAKGPSRQTSELSAYWTCVMYIHVCVAVAVAPDDQAIDHDLSDP